MERHVYSASTLLELRISQSNQHLLDKISQNPDLVPLVKSHDPSTSVQTRRGKKSKEDFQSSTDSEDHVVFLGKKQSRQSAISGEDGEWKYRGRTDVERPSNEPLPAPTGLAAQQSEGFRRFFKAVASPTHVRVTAGGRIVPNTRVSTSPTAKWDKEQPPESDSDELNKHPNSDAASGTTTTPALVPMMGPPMAPPMASPWYPPMLPPWAAPMPFFPLPNGYPMPFPMHPAPPASGRVPSTSTTESEKQDEEDVTGKAKKGGSHGDNKQRPAPIQISPPEQFDHNRPFVYNGHVMYPPVTAHPPFMPAPFFSPAFMGPPPMTAGRPAMLPPMSPMTTMPPVPAMPPYQSGPTQSAQKTSAGDHQSGPQFAPAAAPARPTSIKRSDITKSQLNGLRWQVRFYQDQIKLNKHQIDEKGTNYQIRNLEKHIEHFEHILQGQLDYEARHCPRSNDKTTETDATTCQTPSNDPSVKDDAQKSGSRDSSIKQVNPAGLFSTRNFSTNEFRSHQAFRDKDRRGVIGVNSSVTHDTRPALEAFEAHLREKKRREREQQQKSGLPVGAAQAPPFEPIGMTLANARTADDLKLKDSDLSSEATMKPDYWQDVSIPSTRDRVCSAFDAEVARYGVPYLKGKLPQGLSPQNARPTDYLYSRELTAEEVRARHVYWGEVPSKGLGLPKYDGKNFYPPSPVKTPVEAPDEESDDETARALIAHPRRALLFNSNPRIVAHTGRTPPRDYDILPRMPKLENDPFGSKRTRGNHSVPIVDPQTMKCKISGKTFKEDKGRAPQASAASETRDDAPIVIASPNKAGDKKPSTFSRRGLERSSKSGTELWQSMLKKGPTSAAAAVPTAISSTTATGYLPQYNGHAAASLSPAISNTNGSVARASLTKSGEQEGVPALSATEKLGENCPPRDAPCQKAADIADLHERMLRDAEARGVIGPDWH